MDEKMGEWAFMAGVLLSVLVGLGVGFAGTVVAPFLSVILAILAVLGLVIGYMNIHDKEVNSFLIAGIAFLSIVSGLGNGLQSLKNFADLPQLGQYLLPFVNLVLGIINAMAFFVAPAVFVVALEAIKDMAGK